MVGHHLHFTLTPATSRHTAGAMNTRLRVSPGSGDTRFNKASTPRPTPAPTPPKISAPYTDLTHAELRVAHGVCKEDAPAGSRSSADDGSVPERVISLRTGLALSEGECSEEEAHHHTRARG